MADENQTENPWLWRSYDKVGKLGEGAYGKVYLARQKSTGEMFAVKKAKLLPQEGIALSTLREIGQLKALTECPYIVKLVGSTIAYGYKSQTANLYLIFEVMDGDLYGFIYDRYSDKLLPDNLIQSFAYQLLKGMEFMHSHGVLHRDLKSVNILVDVKNSRVKIADFGVARFYTIPCQQYTPKVVTLWYRAPEMMLGTRAYSPASDVWSMGLIIGELSNREPLFTCTKEIELLKEVFANFGVPTERSWPGVSALPEWWSSPRDVEPPPPFDHLFPNAEPLLLDLLSKMLVLNPAKRYPAKVLLKHPYFDTLDKSLY